MSALQEQIAEEWRRREKKGSSSRSAAATGLLAEMQPVQRAARELYSLLEEIAEEEEATEAEVGVNEERAVEVVERAEALAAACRALAKGLAPLERQVRAVFHRVVASCGEVVHYMEHSVHSANAAPSAAAVSNSSGGDRKYDKICIWESDGDIMCDIVDGAALADEVVVARRSVRTDDGSEGRGLPPPSPAPHIAKWVPPREAKRQGETIAKGDKNYELMLNLQLGIRHAVGKQGPITLDLKSSAFDPKEKVWTKFPPEGSKYTPPHNSCDFRWKDYCPQVFRTLRKLFEVDATDYMLSLCGSEALR